MPAKGDEEVMHARVSEYNDENKHLIACYPESMLTLLSGRLGRSSSISISRNVTDLLAFAVLLDIPRRPAYKFIRGHHDNRVDFRPICQGLHLASRKALLYMLNCLNSYTVAVIA